VLNEKLKAIIYYLRYFYDMRFVRDIESHCSI